MHRTMAEVLAILLMIGASNADDAADIIPEDAFDFAAMRTDMLRTDRLRVVVD